MRRIKSELDVFFKYVCPHDRETLSFDGRRLTCLFCMRTFHVEDGIPAFTKVSDFYEGKYCGQVRLPFSEKLWGRLKLWVANSGYISEVLRVLNSDDVVLDLGCGGGIRAFGERFRVIGIDYSKASLRLAKSYYFACAQADAAKLPLYDDFCDGVVSCYFWEHLLPDQKKNYAAEMYRVTKRGGRAVLLFDVLTQNPLIRLLMRRNSEIFTRMFLTNDGHVGYQSLDDNLEEFRRAGFCIELVVSHERSVIQSSSVYQKMSAYPGIVGLMGAFFWRLSRLCKGYPWMILLRIVDSTIGRFLPRNWGRVATVVIKKV